MKLENGAWYLQDAARKLGRYHPEMIRRVGVTILNVAGRSTPPNRGGFSLAKKASGYGSKNVKAFKARIVSEIIGGTGKLSPLPSAIPTADGRGVRWQGPSFSFGGYAFRVPRNAGKRTVRYVDPEAILARRVFRRKGNVVRARAGKQPTAIHWVRPADLRAAIARRTEKAGKLLGAWLPAAQTLNASNAARDFKVSRFARPGSASLHQDGSGRAYLHMEADWSGLIVGERLLPHFATMVNRAAENGIRNTENWFLKQIFG